MADGLSINLVLDDSQPNKVLSELWRKTDKGLEIDVKLKGPKSQGGNVLESLNVADLHEQIAKLNKELNEGGSASRFIQNLVQMERSFLSMTQPLVQMEQSLRAVTASLRAYDKAAADQLITESQMTAKVQAYNQEIQRSIALSQAELKAKQAATTATKLQSDEYGRLHKSLLLSNKAIAEATLELNKSNRETNVATRTAELLAAAEKRLVDELARQDPELRKTTAEWRKLAEARREAEKAARAGVGGSDNGRATAAGLHLANQAATAFRATLQGLQAQIGIYTSSTILVAAASYKLAQAVRDTIGTGVEFTTAMSQAGAVMDATAFQFARLEEQVLRMAETSYVGATEIAKGLVELGQAGLTAAQSMQAIEPVIQLALIGTIDFAKAADIATTTMQSFGLQATEITDIVNAFAVAAVDSNVTVQQIGVTMSYAAPVAEAYGLALNDVTAAIAILGNAGIVGSRAGTTLRRTIESLYSPTEKAQKALDKLGVVTSSAFGGVKSLEEIFIALSNATNGASTNLDQLEKIVGLYALPGFLRLISAAKGVVDETGKAVGGFEAFSKVLREAAGAAKLMSTQMMDNLEGDFKRLKAAVDKVQLDIFSEAEGPLRKFTQTFTEAIRAFGKSEDGVKKLIASFKELIVDLGVLIGGGALLGLISALNKVWTWFGLLSNHPILRAVSILASAVGLLAVAFDDTAGAVSKFGDSWEQGAREIDKATASVKELATVNGQVIKELEGPARVIVELNKEYELQLGIVQKQRQEYLKIVALYGKADEEVQSIGRVLDAEEQKLEQIRAALDRSNEVLKRQRENHTAIEQSIANSNENAKAMLNTISTSAEPKWLEKAAKWVTDVLMLKHVKNFEDPYPQETGDGLSFDQAMANHKAWLDASRQRTDGTWAMAEAQRGLAGGTLEAILAEREQQAVMARSARELDKAVEGMKQQQQLREKINELNVPEAEAEKRRLAALLKEQEVMKGITEQRLAAYQALLDKVKELDDAQTGKTDLFTTEQEKQLKLQQAVLAVQEFRKTLTNKEIAALETMNAHVMQNKNLVQEIADAQEKVTKRTQESSDAQAKIAEEAGKVAEMMRRVQEAIENPDYSGFEKHKKALEDNYETLRLMNEEYLAGNVALSDVSGYLKQVDELLKEVEKDYQEARKATAEYNKEIRQSYALLDKPAPSSVVGTDAIKDLEKAKTKLEELTSAYMEVYEAWKKVGGAVPKELSRKRDEMREQQEKVKLLQQEATAYHNLIMQYGSAQRAAAAYYEEEKRKLDSTAKSVLTAEEYAAALAKIAARSRELAAGNEMSKTLAQWGNELLNLDKLGSDWLNRFTDSIAEWASGAKGAFKSFFEYVKRSLIQLAARAFVVTITGNFAGMGFAGQALGGAAGSALGGAVGGATGGATGGLLGGLGSFGGGLLGNLGGFGTGFGNTLGAIGSQGFFGSMGGAFTSAGSFLSVGLGSGSFSTALSGVMASIGTVMPYIAAAIGVVMLAKKIFGKKPKATDLGFVANPLGAPGKYEDNAFVETPFSQFGVNPMSSKIDAEEFRGVLEAVKKLDELIAETVGKETTAKVAEYIKNSPDWESILGDTIKLKGKTQEEISKIVGHQVKTYYDQLAEAGAKTGDLFFQVFDREMKKIESGPFEEVMEKITALIGELAVTFKTIEGYYNADILDEANTKWKELNRTMFEAGDVIKAELVKAMDEFDGSFDSLKKIAELTKARYQYEIEMLLFIKQSVQEIKNAAESLKEKMFLDVSSDQDKYAYFTALAEESYRKMLQPGLSPEEVKKYALEALQYTQQAWDLLPEDLKKALRPAFDSFIDALVRDSGFKLEELQSQLVSDSEALRRQIEDFMKQSREYEDKAQAAAEATAATLNDLYVNVRDRNVSDSAQQQLQITTQQEISTGIASLLAAVQNMNNGQLNQAWGAG